MDSAIASSSNFNEIIVSSTLNGYGSGETRNDCNPSNNQSWNGHGKGNGYASLQGTLTVGQFPGYPPGSSGMALRITAQVDGNDSADWTGHNWWFKIWTEDPNAPIAVIDQNNLSAEIPVSSGATFNIKLYQDGNEVDWPASGLSTTVNVNLNLIPDPLLTDRNGDSFVNFFDYAIFANDWKHTPDPCDPNNNDITKNGLIDIYDLAQLVEYWLNCFVTEATIPYPADYAVNVSRNVILQWSPGDNAASHDIFFGTDFNEVSNADVTNSNVYMGNQDANFWDTNNYNVNGLEYLTNYYWRIDEIAGCTAKGDVWNFTTISPPPGQASNPTPDNGVTGISITTDLSWTADSGATSHDVYFGTTNPPPFRCNQTGTTYDTGTMDTNTTYYWRIDEKNTGGTTTGDVWSFITYGPDINNGLAAWWKFDEGIGTIAYDSVGTNNGTIYGTATWTTGHINGALSFNGTSDYVNCGSGPSNYDNITVSAWMKTSTQGTLVSNRYNPSYGTWYTLFSNGIELGGDTNGSGYMNVTFNTPTLDGAWHHIVYTKDGTNHAIYVDGFLDQQFTSNADISWSQPLCIGKRWFQKNASIFWFNGVIDDVRIYNRALTATEVSLLYQQ